MSAFLLLLRDDHYIYIYKDEENANRLTHFCCLDRYMHFDRESTVVITKINNLSESVLTNYCQKFGKILRCFLKTAAQSRSKEACKSNRIKFSFQLQQSKNISDALIKFAETTSVVSVLSHRNHTINGTHVVMRGYHQDPPNSGSGQSLPSLMSSAQQNQVPPTTNGQKANNYEQILEENQSLKCEITNLQRSLAETQAYSRTAYDTFQALREKFGNPFD